MGKIKAPISARLSFELAKKEGMHAVGGTPGLYLCVRDGGASWIFRYSSNGRRRDLGLGSHRDLTLLEARERAREQRKLVFNGIDPITAKRSQRDIRSAELARRMTFIQCVDGYIDAHGDSWRNQKHRDQWRNPFINHGKLICDLDVAIIDMPLVLAVLQPIWKEKTHTATLLRGRIENVLSWATVRGYRQGENPARWRGLLDQVLARPSKIAAVQHHAALPYREMGAFMEKLRTCEGIGARALEFAILTAARSGEVRGATWKEIDLTERLWKIPANRMKANKEHIVPLSEAAIKVIKKMQAQTLDDDPDALVFPGRDAGRPLSDMSLTAVLKRMERGDLTAHGFRSSFSDWRAEVSPYNSEMGEMALAHTIGNKVEAAYRRGNLLEKRFKMMADWAKWCAELQQQSGKVLPLRKQK